MNVSGEVVFSNTNTTTLSPNNVLDPERFNILGNFTLSGTTGILTGTTTIRITGTSNQTWAGGGSTAQIRSDLKVDKTGGTLSITGNIYYNTKLFTYVQGTVNTSSSTLVISTATTTMDTNGSTSSGATTTSSTGINWNNVTLSTTLNLTNNFTCVGTFTSSIGTITRTASQNVYLGGNLTMSGALTSTAATVIMNGTGTWSGGGAVTAPLTFNTSGTITVSGTVVFSTRTLTYITAASVVTTGSTLTASTSCTLATNGMTWNNFTCNATATITLSNNFSFSGTLRLGEAIGVTITYGGVGALSATSTASVVLGLQQFGVGGGSTINFPTSTVLNIASLTIQCPGNTNVGHNTTVNNATFNVSGNFALNYSNQGMSYFTGTSTSVNMIGSGSITTSGSIASASINVPFTINTSGTYTFSTGNIFTNTTVTYISGTLSGSTVVFTGCTLNLNAGGDWVVATVIRGATTLTSNATFTNTLTTNTTAVTFSGAFTINVKGNLEINTTTSGASTPIVINGTGNQTWTATSYLSNTLTINKPSGNLTLGANIYYNTGILTYTAANLVDTTTNSTTLTINGSCTLATNGISWVNISNVATATITLSNDLVWTNNWNVTAGTISFSGANNLNPASTANIAFSGSSTVSIKNNIQVTNATVGVTTINTNQIAISGNLTVASTTSGSTTLLINGTGSQSWTHITANYLSNSVTINKASGTLTLGATIYYSTGTLTYTAGTVNTTTNSTTLRYNAAVILNTWSSALNDGITWVNIVFQGGTVTTTINTDLVWSGTFTQTSGTLSFNGTGSLAPVSTANLTLSSGISFSVKNNIQITNLSLNNSQLLNNTVSILGNLTVNSAQSGSNSVINFNGTGSQTWSHSVASSFTATPITINKPTGALTLSGQIYFQGSSLTYTANSSSVITTGSTFNIAASSTLTTSGITWNAINWSGGTITLANALTATGLITVTHAAPVLNGSDLYANGGMNYTASNISGNFSFISGTSTIRFEGTGSWTSPNYGTYRNNVIINPTGSFSINVTYVLGTITYSSSNGGTISSAYVTVGYYTATSSIGLSRSVTFNTNDMLWNQIYCMSYTNSNVSPTASTITCLSNLNVYQLFFASIGTGQLDSFTFSFSEGFNITNLYNLNLDARVTVNLGKDLVTETLIFGTGIYQRLNNFSVKVNRLLTSSASQGAIAIQGSTKIIMANKSSWQRTDGNTTLYFNMEFQGNITFGTTAFPTMVFAGNTLAYTGTNVSSPVGRGSFQIASNATLTNLNKIVFTNLIISSGVTLTMNEFFSGSANIITPIQASSTTNYTITFTDNFEKIAKFVNISGCTLSRPQQLLLITNSKKSSTNTRGIRYINSLPNGIPKGEPSTMNSLGFSTSNYLAGDPAFVKTI